MPDFKKILAEFNEKTITVYQVFDDKIADEALKIGTFGPNFDLNRMSWIKTSFLWMMYRCGWGTNEGQERILAIEIFREGFDEILPQAILSKYKSNIYENQSEWKNKLKKSDVGCKWDPDRDVYGNSIGRKAIQLGIRGDVIEKYVNQYIYRINDISQDVLKYKCKIIDDDFDICCLPEEKEYPTNDDVKIKLDI